MKHIIISKNELPTDNIGSWTNRLSQYLQSDFNKVDLVLSPQDGYNINQKVKFINFKGINRLGRSLSDNIYYYNLNDKMIKLLKNNDCYNFLIFDDFKLLKYLHKFLIRKGYRKKCQITFSFHGHIIDQLYGNEVIADHILLLTNKSYIDSIRYHSIVSRFHLLGNSINTNVFYEYSERRKIEIRTSLGIKKDDHVIVWLSNPKPKKGGFIAKSVFRKLVKEKKSLKLLIIGENDVYSDDNIISVGRLPNSEIPKYLNAGNSYWFTSLWQEGYGLSFLEAVACGLYPIVSNIGGIPEVFETLDGYGSLVDYPHFVESWFNAFNNYLLDKEKIDSNLKKEIAQEIIRNNLDHKDWFSNFNSILNEIEECL